MNGNKIKKTILMLFALVMYAGGIASAVEITDAEKERANDLYKQGVEYTRNKEYAKAVTLFNEALKYNPALGDAYYNIASINISQNKIDDAYANYVKAVAINPQDYESIVQAAKIAYNRKNYALAMKYLKFVPDDAEQYYFARQLYNDANEMFNSQTTKTERAKITTATTTKKVLIDKFNSPAGVAIDSEGNMYVACYSDNAIMKYDKNKKKSVYAKDYLLDGPVGLAMDAYDNLYIANFDANNILKVTKSGNVSIFMENVSKPYFLYIKNDVLYVSEQGNDAVATYKLGR